MSDSKHPTNTPQEELNRLHQCAAVLWFQLEKMDLLVPLMEDLNPLIALEFQRARSDWWKALEELDAIIGVLDPESNMEESLDPAIQPDRTTH